jgi:hypothetical protein
MSTSGKLIVFEGPDGVGKSTLAKGLVDSLAGRGTPCDLLAFPGREAGTLGRHVYDLHHDPGRFGVANIPPASLQLLHVAAHLDAITGHILPALRAGRWVVLDRFWWSTWVYGLAAGVKKVSLEPMLAVERPEWDGVVPMAVFLVRRGSPLRGDVPIDRWRQLVSGYNDLALVEQAGHAVFHIENEGTRDEAVRRALEALDGLRFRVATPARGRRRAKRAVGRGRQPAPRAADLFSSSAGNGEDLGPVDVRKVPNAFCPMSPAKPSEVYQTYWRFAAERQAVFFRRIEGVRPLTDDPILARYKFCNAYRASDRVSQYLVRNVIYLHDQSPSEIVFRTLLFKLFNKIETWERLERELGTPCYGTFEVERYAALLEKALAAGEAIYSAAYIMPSGSGDFEDGRKHRSHLRLLEKMMQDRLAGRLGECRTMRQAFDLIRTYPMIGDFLAYQYVTDINYSTVTDFSEMQFVVPGPARSKRQDTFVRISPAPLEGLA